MLNNDDFIYPCANTHLINQELEETINKFGSFITIMTNKPVSCVTMFIIIQKYPELRDVLVTLTETTWYSVVEYMAHRYPVLNKTKKIKKSE
jgi:hypothetical protein